MSLKVGVVMDPIAKIKPWKDSTFAMMLEAQRRGHRRRRTRTCRRIGARAGRRREVSRVL